MLHPSVPASRSRRFLAIVGIGVAAISAAATACVPSDYTRTPVTTARAGTTSATTAASAAPSAAVPEEVHLTVKEWGFTPAQLQLPIGQPVRQIAGLLVRDTKVLGESELLALRPLQPRPLAQEHIVDFPHVLDRPERLGIRPLGLLPEREPG